MACLGFEPGAAGWQAQMDPLSYGGTPSMLFHDFLYICKLNLSLNCEKQEKMAKVGQFLKKKFCVYGSVATL